jgi:hypothetical protein
MIFFNSIINAKGTPSVYEDTLANRPAASTIGRLFVATNSPYGIYRDQGTSWQLITGSGGGGSQNWDNVLSLGGSLTQNRSFNFDYNFGLTFANGTYFQLQNIPLFKILYSDNSNVFFTNNYLKYFTSTNVNTVYSFDYSNGNVALGDFGGQSNGTHLNVEVSNNRIYFAPGGYLISLFQQGLAIIGDGLNQVNLTKFFVDDNNKVIYSSFDGADQGIKLESNYTSLGDFDNNLLSYKILIDNSDGGIISYTDSSGYWTGFYLFSPNDVRIGNQFQYMLSDEGGSVIKTYNSGTNEFGLYIDFSAQQTVIGDYDGNLNGTSINVYDVNQSITFSTENLNFYGTNLLSGSSGSTSGQHLSIYINGTHYKIQLRNP